MSIDQPFSNEGYALMGAAFEVHNELGGGLKEEIYQQSLEKEPGFRGFPFATKKVLTSITKGNCLKRNIFRT